MNNYVSLFDPNEWANKGKNETSSESKAVEAMSSHVINNDDTAEKIKAVVDVLSSYGIDITDGYDNWFHAGKSLANELGESGRGLFHEVSKQSSQYTFAETDKKYDQCLHDSDRSIGIGSFFQLAKDHGVDLSAICKEVFKDAVANSQISATSAKAPVGGSKNENHKMVEDTSYNKREIQYNPPTGGMAEVAEMSQTYEQLTTAYTFSDKLNPDHLVGVLRDIYEMHKTEPAKCDAMLLGAINIISGLMGGANGTTESRSGVYGVYDGRRVFAPLYTIVYSGAGNDKGNLVFCKHLAHDVKNEIRKQYLADKQKYEDDMAEYDAQKRSERGPAPKEPAYRTPFIPGNSTSSAVYRILDANQGWGMMFETEADTISNMIGSEYGDYSDLMRKAHHHETLSMERVKDNLHVEIEEPRLSIFLTCTPDQLPKLLPSFDNGLGSRFVFYNIPEKDVVFHDVFALEKKPLEDIYKSKSYHISALFHALQSRVGHPIQFTMSDSQQSMFLDTYRETLQTQFKMLGKGIRAFIFRMALENFRIAMILTVLRRLNDFMTRTAEDAYNGAEQVSMFDVMENALTCSNEDFETASTIIGCLINHTARVYAVMAHEEKNPFSTKGITLTAAEQAVYKALPDTDFKAAEFLEIAKQTAIPERTAQRMLSNMANVYQILIPVCRGVYRKTPITED